MLSLSIGTGNDNSLRVRLRKTQQNICMVLFFTLLGFLCSIIIGEYIQYSPLIIPSNNAHLTMPKYSPAVSWQHKK
jgi:hypothetical protein